jgi:hypothetical protein
VRDNEICPSGVAPFRARVFSTIGCRETAECENFCACGQTRKGRSDLTRVGAGRRLTGGPGKWPLSGWSSFAARVFGVNGSGGANWRSAFFGRGRVAAGFGAVASAVRVADAGGKAADSIVQSRISLRPSHGLETKTARDLFLSAGPRQPVGQQKERRARCAGAHHRSCPAPPSST